LFSLPHTLQVLEGVTPQVQFVKVVSEQLIELMGNAGAKDLDPAPPGQPQVGLFSRCCGCLDVDDWHWD
jgi:signal recognition particle GTPase